TEVTQRDSVLRSEFAWKLADAGRQRAVPALRDRACVVVVRHDIPGEGSWIRGGGSRRRDGDRGQITGPQIGQVAVLVRESSIPLPTDADVEGQAVVDFPIVLKERVLILQVVIVDDPVHSAAHAEEATV